MTAPSPTAREVATIRVRIDLGSCEWEGDIKIGEAREVMKEPWVTAEVVSVSGLAEVPTALLQAVREADRIRTEALDKPRQLLAHEDEDVDRALIALGRHVAEQLK